MFDVYVIINELHGIFYGFSLSKDENGEYVEANFTKTSNLVTNNVLAFTDRDKAEKVLDFISMYDADKFEGSEIKSFYVTNITEDQKELGVIQWKYDDLIKNKITKYGGNLLLSVPVESRHLH